MMMMMIDDDDICLLLYLETAAVAKSSIVLDVKPWDDETDMSEIERCVRSIHTDGLLWGVCKHSYLLTYLLTHSYLYPVC